jgi:hypothetical protein
MADFAAKKKAVVLAGTDSRAFADEILSVHFDNRNFPGATSTVRAGRMFCPH